MFIKILHALLLFAALFGTWYVFSGEDSMLFMIFGGISAGLSTALALRMNVVDNEGHPFHLLLTAPLYWLWLAKEMVVSGLNVTRLVWTPENHSTPSFAWVKTQQRSDLGRTIFANSLTLTPGTVCVDIEDNRVFIHALEKSVFENDDAVKMDTLVARLTARHALKQQKKAAKKAAKDNA